jgi:hypothetical protein
LRAHCARCIVFYDKVDCDISQLTHSSHSQLTAAPAAAFAALGTWHRSGASGDTQAYYSCSSLQAIRNL